MLESGELEEIRENPTLASRTRTAFQISEILTELDFVKRELYEQIDINRAVKREKDQLQRNVTELEEQMNETVMSYQQVIMDA